MFHQQLFTLCYSLFTRITGIDGITICIFLFSNIFINRNKVQYQGFYIMKTSQSTPIANPLTGFHVMCYNSMIKLFSSKLIQVTSNTTRKPIKNSAPSSSTFEVSAYDARKVFKF